MENQQAQTPVEENKDARMWGMLAHISGIILGFIGPLVIWLIKKEEFAFVNDQGKEALNFQIVIVIAYLVSGALTFVCIGFILIPAVMVVNIVFCIIAGMKANNGVQYRYPLNLGLVEKVWERLGPVTERIVHAIAVTVRPRWLVRLFIRVFARLYCINLAAVGAPLLSFPSLLSFFLRQPLSGSRPVDAEALSIVSPVDARVTACGTATADSILLVKGHPASLRELAGEPLPEFEGGQFVMLYLSPADIHRIYTPCDATVARSWRIEGSLYPVGPCFVAKRPRTFVINRRVLTELTTPHGRIMMVKVGARNVGRIITHHPVPCGAASAHTYRKGAEAGWFELGSTVILLLERGKFTLDPRVADGARVMIGQAIGRAVQS